MIQFKVNGIDQSLDGDPDMPVLWYLRDVLGLTGTKFGCGAALCGACTVPKAGGISRLKPHRHSTRKNETRFNY
jgi:isoquinoline 1-oxidoreductase subunit alpha